MIGPLTRLISYLTGVMASCPLPRPARRPTYEFYAKLFGANLGEVEYSLSEYRSLADFFVRRLQPGARPFSGEVGSPVDALLYDAGLTAGRTAFEAKGVQYNLEQILIFQGQEALTADYHYFLFHLRPGDYHRIHYPFDCELVEVAHAPGKLLPVNELGRRYFPDVFCVNERVLLKLRSKFGDCYLAMFGALNVGSMFVNGVDLSTNTNPFEPGDPKETKVSGLRFEQGDELGGFKMGSSVMLLIPAQPSLPHLDQHLPRDISVGQALFGE